MARQRLRQAPGLRDGPHPDSSSWSAIIGYTSLGLDRFPNVDFPIVTSSHVLPGAAPQEIETEVTDKIEEAVNTISGIEELQLDLDRGRLAV